MIEGIKATVPGKDVIKLINAQIDRLNEKAKTYQTQVDALTAAGIDMTNNSGDPKAAANAKVKDYLASATELSFISGYIVPTETYNLSITACSICLTISRCTIFRNLVLFATHFDMKTKTKVKHIEEKIAKLEIELEDIQDNCDHPKENLEKKGHSDTGNWCKSDDRYWYRFHCGVCNKIWMEEQ